MFNCRSAILALFSRCRSHEARKSESTRRSRSGNIGPYARDRATLEGADVFLFVYRVTGDGNNNGIRGGEVFEADRIRACSIKRYATRRYTCRTCVNVDATLGTCAFRLQDLRSQDYMMLQLYTYRSSWYISNINTFGILEEQGFFEKTHHI